MHGDRREGEVMYGVRREGEVMHGVRRVHGRVFDRDRRYVHYLLLLC